MFPISLFAEDMACFVPSPGPNSFLLGLLIPSGPFPALCRSPAALPSQAWGQLMGGTDHPCPANPMSARHPQCRVFPCSPPICWRGSRMRMRSLARMASHCSAWLHRMAQQCTAAGSSSTEISSVPRGSRLASPRLLMLQEQYLPLQWAFLKICIY